MATGGILIGLTAATLALVITMAVTLPLMMVRVMRTQTAELAHKVDALGQRVDAEAAARREAEALNARLSAQLRGDRLRMLPRSS
jgi:hypothetical protein